MLPLVALMIALAITSAVEDPSDQLIMICGDDIPKALQEACDNDTVEYLLEHGQYDPQDPKHRHHRNRDHGHGQVYDHGLNDKDIYSVVQTKKNGKSISEKCCDSPCHIKDFVSYCV